jgi:hypothetical protein
MATVDGLREGAVQERILYIKLMNRPRAGDGQGEHGADRGRLDHRAKGLIATDAGSLGEATKNPASLVLFQRPVEIELVLKNPPTGDDVKANEARDKIPSVVCDQGSKFLFHGATPIRINEGGADRGGHR